MTTSPLTYFTAQLLYYAITADTAADADYDPQTEGVSAGVTITAHVVNNPPEPDAIHVDEIPVTMLSPQAATLVLAPIDARLDHGGQLCLRYDPDIVVHSYTGQSAFPATGVTTQLYWAADVDKMYRWDPVGPPPNRYVETEAFAPVRLVCDSDLLELPTGAFLAYQLEFDHVRFAGADRELPGFAFRAPSTDIVLDLADPAAAQRVVIQ